jgi:hypothetical protein
MHASSRLLNWGVFLVVLGAFVLSVQAGLIEAGAAGQLLRWWPVMLIVIGLSIVLSRTAFPLVGGLLLAATAGLFIGALLAGGMGAFSSACAGTDEVGGETTTRNGTFTGGSGTGDVFMELTCANVTVARSAGAAWTVEARHAEGRPPVIDAFFQRLMLGTNNSDGFTFFGGEPRRDWNLTLPTEVVLHVRATFNASRGQVDLGGGPLLSLSATFNASDFRLALSGADARSGPLNLDLNASSVTVSLPSSGTGATSSVTVNASSLTLCAPPELGLRVDIKETLGSHNLAAAGLAEVAGAWQTPGYDSAAARSDLSFTSNVSSITFDRSGGCP